MARFARGARLGASVLFWLIESAHGLSGGLEALGAVLALVLGGLCGADDLRRVDWQVLILIGGGLALGAGLQRTGLDKLLVAAPPLPAEPGLLLMACFIVATILLSTFISNTATASLMLPMAVAAVLGRCACRRCSCGWGRSETQWPLAGQHERGVPRRGANFGADTN